MEAAVTALDAREALGLGGALAAALAADRQHAAIHRHLDVVRVDAGEVGVQHEAVALLLHVDPRHPLAGDDVAVVAAPLVQAGAFQESVEHLPELVLGRAQCRPLAVTDYVHGGYSRWFVVLSGGRRAAVGQVGATRVDFKGGPPRAAT